MSKRGIIFDFDGVLIDSFEAVYESVLYDNPTLTHAQFRKGFEMHLHDAQNAHSFSLENYYNEFSKRVDGLEMAASVLDFLQDLSEDYELHIVSSNYEKFINEILVKHGVDVLFESVLGWNSSSYKTEKFKRVFDGRSENDFCFITDTAGDINEAHQVELLTLGYTGGFHSKEILEKAEPYAIIDTLNSIKNYL